MSSSKPEVPYRDATGNTHKKSDEVLPCGCQVVTDRPTDGHTQRNTLHPSRRAGGRSSYTDRDGTVPSRDQHVRELCTPTTELNIYSI